MTPGIPLTSLALATDINAQVSPNRRRRRIKGLPDPAQGSSTTLMAPALRSAATAKASVAASSGRR